MVLVLKRGATKEEIAELKKKLAAAQAKKGVNTKKYCGVLKLDEDPMDIQKRLRDEWD
jgi:hypothetical protein